MQKRITFMLVFSLVVLGTLLLDSKKEMIELSKDNIFHNESKEEKGTKQQKRKLLNINAVKENKIELLSLKLPSELQGKILLSDADKQRLKMFYSHSGRINTAIENLRNVVDRPIGQVGMNRIDSVDFLEKSLRYRSNQNRSRILSFISEYILNDIQAVSDIASRRFFVGDKLELLEVLAYNQPREFFELKARVQDPKILKMISLVEHLSKAN